MIVLGRSQVEVKRTVNRGAGVFAKQDIAKGAVVADYLGTVYDLNSKLPKYPGLYDMWAYKDLTICPDISKNGAHLINHSCEPNCAMYPYKGHILIVSLRKISKGEELTYHYWCSTDSIYMKCKCGSKQCRGSWLVTAKECKKYCDWVEKRNEKYFNKIEPGYTFQPLKKYPSIKISKQKFPNWI